MLVDDDTGGRGEARLRRQFDIGQHPDTDDDHIRRQMTAIAEADAGHSLAVALDAGRLHAEENADAGRAVLLLKILRDLDGDRARHHAGTKLDDVDLEALDPRSRGKFKADEARADH